MKVIKIAETVAGVDELTLVLQVPVTQKMKLENASQWAAMASATISIFAQKAKFEQAFGKQEPCQNVPAGYKIGYTYGEHSFYFVIAFNQFQYSMGIVVKFSAEALSSYLSQTSQTVYSFLQTVQSDDYELRLSRIDFDIDFLSPTFTVASINKQLKKTVEICTQKTVKGKKIMARKPLKLRGFEVEKDIKTLYAGSPQSDTELRIYHKGEEQITKKGFRLDLALQHPKWIRFEAVFRGEYAHQLTKKLLEVSSDKQLSDLILNVFLQKYYFRFRKSKRPTAYTQTMKKLLTAPEAPLMPLSTEDHELEKKLSYLLGSSGMMSNFFAVQQLWGDDGLQKLLQHIFDELQDWQPTYSAVKWVRYHQNDTLKTYPTIDEFLKKV